MKKSIGNYKGNDLYLVIESYCNNGRLCLNVEINEEISTEVTTNLSELEIKDDNYIYLSGNTNKEFKEFLIKNEIIEEPIDIVQYNRGIYYLAKVDFDKIKEYDPEGFKEFQKNLEKQKIQDQKDYLTEKMEVCAYGKSELRELYSLDKEEEIEI